MTSRFLLLLSLAFVAGCATAPNGYDGATAATDPTYPGHGVHIGIGAGTWGGRSGGGVGIGLGW